MSVLQLCSPVSGSRPWMCTSAAPASYARRASSAISTGEYGRWGHCSRRASTPVSAHVTMTLSPEALPCVLLAMVCLLVPTGPSAVLPLGRALLEEGGHALGGILGEHVERELAREVL